MRKAVIKSMMSFVKVCTTPFIKVSSSSVHLKHIKSPGDWRSDVYKAVNKYLKVLGSAFLPLSLLLFSRGASAKFSDLAPDWKMELGAIAQIILLGIAAIGVCTAGIAVITGIKAKKDGRPLEWQTWGFIGGALATVIPFFILAAAGSLTGDDGNGQNSLNELNLR